MLFKFGAMLSIILTLTVFCQAKDWRGIKPLHSTRKDVDRVLGPPSTPGGDLYKLRDENVSILFSTGSCQGNDPEEWNVPPDTVINIDVYPQKKTLIDDLPIDKSKFKKVVIEHLPSYTSYVNEEEGIVITTIFDIEVTRISYGPTTRDSYLRCAHSRTSTNQQGTNIRTDKHRPSQPRRRRRRPCK